ncbi:MAG: 4Fe-4S dicluster domain-containing protein [Candidatus Hodarchaeales archaeon]
MDHNLCIRCLKCVKSCPAEILVREKTETGSNDSKFQITVSNNLKCFECRACEVICPVNAIQVHWVPNTKD